jgi:hypothetical protein
MAIKVASTAVINDSLELQNIASLDTTTENLIKSVVTTVNTTFDGVGSTGFFPKASENTNVLPGATLAGSKLGYYNILPGTIQLYASSAIQTPISNAAGTPSGTWRNMGPGASRHVGSSQYTFNLFARIS